MKDLPPKEDKENFTGVFVLKLIQSECIADLDGEDEIDSKNLQSGKRDYNLSFYSLSEIRV